MPDALGALDLRVLPLRARLLALVVRREQQDDLLAMCVAKDAQEDVSVRGVQICRDGQPQIVGAR